MLNTNKINLELVRRLLYQHIAHILNVYIQRERERERILIQSYSFK